jgi:hypothetical protein
VRTLVSVLVTAAITSAAAPVMAQPQERVFISLNGALQTTKNPFTDRFTFDVNRETGSTETDYPIDGDLVIDGSVAVRLWRNFAAGVAVSQFQRDGVVTTVSRVPHPFFFETPREVTGDVGVKRSERAVHVQGVLRFKISRPIAVSLFGGPSFFDLEQDVVSAVQYDEAFPYDTATFRRAVTTQVSGSAVGFNVGADVAWMFTRNVGIGGLARFARATVDVDLPGGRAKALEAGGFSGGGGLRIAF